MPDEGERFLGREGGGGRLGLGGLEEKRSKIMLKGKGNPWGKTASLNNAKSKGVTADSAGIG